MKGWSIIAKKSSNFKIPWIYLPQSVFFTSLQSNNRVSGCWHSKHNYQYWKLRQDSVRPLHLNSSELPSSPETTSLSKLTLSASGAAAPKCSRWKSLSLQRWVGDKLFIHRKWESQGQYRVVFKVECAVLGFWSYPSFMI